MAPRVPTPDNCEARALEALEFLRRDPRMARIVHRATTLLALRKAAAILADARAGAVTR